MAKGSNQKLKLLYLARIFSEKTDEEHGLSVREIISLLKQYGVNANRKTIYLDIEELNHYGLDITHRQEGRNVYYHLSFRDFELPELKLLVDSVQASRFITEGKSAELIKKLEGLASSYDARKLQRQVLLSGRAKSKNESIYYHVDKIQEAIVNDQKIQFQYFKWNEKKEQELQHDGEWYHISPWNLIWDNENYYLIGYDSNAGMMKHYRVDKMLHLDSYNEKRDGQKIYKGMNIAKYSKELFGMYGGDPENVTLLCEKSLASPIIDRFGVDVNLSPVDEGHFQVTVEVVPSPQFRAWIIGLGTGVKITSPVKVVEDMKEDTRRLCEQYLD